MSVDGETALVDSTRRKAEDKHFISDVNGGVYSNYFFLRLIAKKKKFEGVDFKYSIFDSCYLRNCFFDSCDFTGSRFIGTNLVGSSFAGCKFDYAHFERTLVDNDILDSSCPGHENLKMRFSRSLRTNYQQIGDSKSVNKAIGVELDACGVYLLKAWKSNESYYRKKYSGWRRFVIFWNWVEFIIMDYVWGNGESALKLLRSVFFILALMAALDIFSLDKGSNTEAYLNAIACVPGVFLGVAESPASSPLYLAFIATIRLIAFGLFMSILIKRFNRR